MNIDILFLDTELTDYEQFFDKNSSTFTSLISSGPGREAIIIDCYWSL